MFFFVCFRGGGRAASCWCAQTHASAPHATNERDNTHRRRRALWARHAAAVQQDLCDARARSSLHQHSCHTHTHDTKQGNRIRKIDASGTISTVIGSGVQSSTGDGGPATAATTNTPDNIAINAANGDIFFAENQVCVCACV